jgi:hypothetical protein
MFFDKDENEPKEEPQYEDIIEGPGFFEAMVPGDDLSSERILDKLTTVDKNIAVKTELINPLVIARLQAYARWCKNEEMTIADDIITKFIKDYMVDMISNKRKGRLEVIHAISEKIRFRMKNGFGRGPNESFSVDDLE